MTILVDEVTKIITVPKADLLATADPIIFQHDTELFRLELRDWESSVPGSWRSITHSHNQPVTVGGVTLAQVIEIINGYTITYEDGQYRVILLGSNNNILDVANVNQVSIAPTNSAGLTYSKEIQDLSFGDARVWIDTVLGADATQYPTGIAATPVDGFVNAELIIANRNLSLRLHLKNTMTLLGTDNFDNYDIKGGHESRAIIVLTPGVSTSGSFFQGIHVSGTASGAIVIEDGDIGTLVNFEGHAKNSELSGVITLSVLEETEHEFRQCYSGIAGTGAPTIDCNDIVDLDLLVRGYHGGLELRNISDAGSAVSVDLDSGHLKLAATCTAGTIAVRGTGHLTDNSGAGCTVVRTGLTIGAEIQDIHQFRGLDPDNDLLIQDGSQTVDGKTVVVSDDGTTTTVNRTP